VEQLSKRERVMYLRRLAVRSEVMNLSPEERKEIMLALFEIADELERELPPCPECGAPGCNALRHPRGRDE
jgi:hypothetical protein